jgi:Asp-tRNA(Asn)/Glu-tRNA(Gln) amidotransferase A subunit family amidase
VGRMHELQQEFIKYWRKQNLDFLVVPGFATEAASHGSSKDGSFLATYTYVFNVLRVASCSQPITVTREN